MNLRAALREVVGSALGHRRLYRVSGQSMLPTLRSGDLVWVDVSAAAQPELGALVVVRSPEPRGKPLVKRVSSLGDSTFAVGSDSPVEARDSRSFGSLKLSHFIGTVIAHWSPSVLRDT
ncbi:MAG: S26 family signal peptidase [Myxococcota bacterium]